MRKILTPAEIADDPDAPELVPPPAGLEEEEGEGEGEEEGEGATTLGEVVVVVGRTTVEGPLGVVVVVGGM